MRTLESDMCLGTRRAMNEALQMIRVCWVCDAKSVFYVHEDDTDSDCRTA